MSPDEPASPEDGGEAAESAAADLCGGPCTGAAEADPIFRGHTPRQAKGTRPAVRAASGNDRAAGEASAITYRRYRAPQRHGEILADPPLAQLPSLVADNAALLRDRASQLLGRPAFEFRRAARDEFLRQARQYTQSYRDVQIPAAGADGLVLLTGHQPRLFHPGVWFKNFVLGRAARELNATAVHLIVDNDLAGSPSIRVPAGAPSQPHLETVAFDAPANEVPWEERTLIDRECFESFGGRVAETIRSLVPHPLIEDWWPTAIAASREVDRLGLALARARHILEGEWGLETLELPLSQMCDTDGFRQFLAALWSDLPRFVEVYNQSLLEYRQVHRIRSRSHPVPQLERDQDAWEAPCWIWTAQSPQRRRLFVRCTPRGLTLTDRGTFELRLPATSGGDSAAIAALADLAAHGVKIRPRALLTTMYARTVLSDLFIHGIGGGKYDQLTDAIVRRFFGLEPPQFLVLSATAELPITRPRAEAAERQELDRLIRDLRFNPDRYIPVTDETRRWIEAKQEWLRTNLPRGSRRARHEGIEQANAALAPFAAPRLEALVARRIQIDEELRIDRLLGSREFPFCLFPAATLQSLLLDKNQNGYKLVEE